MASTGCPLLVRYRNYVTFFFESLSQFFGRGSSVNPRYVKILGSRTSLVCPSRFVRTVQEEQHVLTSSPALPYRSFRGIAEHELQRD